MVMRRRYGARRYWTNQYKGRFYGRYERGDSGDTQGSGGSLAWNPINYPGTWRPGGFRGPSGSTGSGGFVKLLGYGFGATGGFNPMVRGYSLD